MNKLVHQHCIVHLSLSDWLTKCPHQHKGAASFYYTLLLLLCLNCSVNLDLVLKQTSCHAREWRHPNTSAWLGSSNKLFQLSELMFGIEFGSFLPEKNDHPDPVSSIQTFWNWRPLVQYVLHWGKYSHGRLLPWGNIKTALLQPPNWHAESQTSALTPLTGFCN